MTLHHPFKLLILSTGFLFLTACNLPSQQQIAQEVNPPDLDAIVTQIASGTQSISSTSEPLNPSEAVESTLTLPTPASEPAKTLTICLGKEPQTLFFYNESSQSMWSVLESIYDGPFDQINGKAQPVILENITIETESVPVEKDDVVLSTAGNIVAMKSGVKIETSNGEKTCGQTKCELTWQNGLTEIEMSQTTITFKLKEGLLWSDGEPLTSEDSVFSMNVNGMKGIKATKSELNHTESYTAEDETTLVWKGIPGYIPQQAADVFWIPLPKHLMQGMSVDELLSSESVNRAPIGWGAYRIESWEAGSQIHLLRNPNYISADGSQPYFDQIDYKFFGRAGDNNLEALRDGSCDIIDTSVDLSVDLEPILEDVRDSKLSVYIQPEDSWQQLTFGISSTQEDRPVNYTDFFSSADVRKALTQCINRKQLIREVYYGQAEIPLGFYPSGHAWQDPALKIIDYDPEAGKAALNTLGWRDADNDPLTPLTAESVSGVGYGTAFSIDLAIIDSPLNQKAAEMIKANLNDCGVEVTIVPQKLTDFYGQGPDGTLFGRKFDLASFAWSAGLSSPCTLYASDQIPNADNNWIGVNVGGYASSPYDEACLAAQKADPLNESSLSAYQAVQQLYAQELPVIPLYFNFSIGVSSNQICGIADTIGSRSLLWNIESLSRSENACAVSQWTNIYE